MAVIVTIFLSLLAQTAGTSLRVPKIMASSPSPSAHWPDVSISAGTIALFSLIWGTTFYVVFLAMVLMRILSTQPSVGSMGRPLTGSSPDIEESASPQTLRNVCEIGWTLLVVTGYLVVHWITFAVVIQDDILISSLYLVVLVLVSLHKKSRYTNVMYFGVMMDMSIFIYAAAMKGEDSKMWILLGSCLTMWLFLFYKFVR